MSVLLGAIAFFNVGGAIIGLISGIETPNNIHRIFFILLVTTGAIYLFQLSKNSVKENAKLVKFITFTIPISAILVAVIFIVITVFFLQKKEHSQYDEIYLKNQASSINKQLPIMIDDGLEAFLIEAVGLSLVNHYRFVNFQANELDPSAVKKALKEIVDANACNDKGLKSLLLNDISIIYKVYGKEKNLITNIVVSKEACQ